MSYSTGLNILEPQIINRERIQDLINSFSSIGASESGSVSRRAFSDEDIYARNFFIKTLKDLGLKIRIDTAGNIIARLDGNDNNCLLYTSPSPRDGLLSRMPSSA